MGQELYDDPVSGGTLMREGIYQLRDVNEAFHVYSGGKGVYIINEEKELHLFSDLTMSEYSWLVNHPNNNFLFFILNK